MGVWFTIYAADQIAGISWTTPSGSTVYSKLFAYQMTPQQVSPAQAVTVSLQELIDGGIAIPLTEQRGGEGRY